MLFSGGLDKLFNRGVSLLVRKWFSLRGAPQRPLIPKCLRHILSWPLPHIDRAAGVSRNPRAGIISPENNDRVPPSDPSPNAFCDQPSTSGEDAVAVTTIEATPGDQIPRNTDRQTRIKLEEREIRMKYGHLYEKQKMHLYRVIDKGHFTREKFVGDKGEFKIFLVASSLLPVCVFSSIRDERTSKTSLGLLHKAELSKLCIVPSGMDTYFAHPDLCPYLVKPIQSLFLELAKVSREFISEHSVTSCQLDVDSLQCKMGNDISHKAQMKSLGDLLLKRATEYWATHDVRIPPSIPISSAFSEPGGEFKMVHDNNVPFARPVLKDKSNIAKNKKAVDRKKDISVSQHLQPEHIANKGTDPVNAQSKEPGIETISVDVPVSGVCDSTVPSPRLASSIIAQHSTGLPRPNGGPSPGLQIPPRFVTPPLGPVMIPLNALNAFRSPNVRKFIGLMAIQSGQRVTIEGARESHGLYICRVNFSEIPYELFGGSGADLSEETAELIACGGLLLSLAHARIVPMELTKRIDACPEWGVPLVEAMSPLLVQVVEWLQQDPGALHMPHSVLSGIRDFATEHWRRTLIVMPAEIELPPMRPDPSWVMLVNAPPAPIPSSPQSSNQRHEPAEVAQVVQSEPTAENDQSAIEEHERCRAVLVARLKVLQARMEEKKEQVNRVREKKVKLLMETAEEQAAARSQRSSPNSNANVRGICENEPPLKRLRRIFESGN